MGTGSRIKEMRQKCTAASERYCESGAVAPQKHFMLKRSQPEVLENGLRTMYLRAMAQKLDSSVLDNDISMEEIVDEVNAVRKERYDKQNRI